MLGKISNQNWNPKIAQDDQIVDEIIKKSKVKDADKARDDAFTMLLEENINEERNQLRLLRKKSKKHHDESSLVLIPNIYNLPKIQTNTQIRVGKGKQHKCSRCGNMVGSDDTVEVNQEKRSSYVCSKCMNKEIADFLTYNYL